ncbi:hypothetical protein DFJ77DRAFT_523277 [Powellomyces hirtus]|nr:hypothetical protein DFJ77DRAFT_523277 [Powellomyces hirtus]
MPPPAKAGDAAAAPNPLAESIALVATSGNHTVKLTLECHYALEKEPPAIQPVTHQRKARGAGGGVPEKPRKSPMDDYRKFYLVWSIAGVYEGKTDILLWDGAPWTWSHDVQVKSSFLADLYDKPTTVQVFEIVKPAERGNSGGASGTLNSLPRHVAANGGEDSITLGRAGGLIGSRLRMGGQLTANDRRMSMSALAKRQITLANAQLPVRERHNLVQRASAIGYGIQEVVFEPAGVPSNETDDPSAALRRKITTWQDSSDDEDDTMLKKKKEKTTNNELAPPLQRPNSGGSRASSPRRRVFENPDGTTLREAPQPHHYDRPDRHLSASARSRELEYARTSPEPGGQQPPQTPPTLRPPVPTERPKSRSPVPKGRTLTDRRVIPPPGPPPVQRKSLDKRPPVAASRNASARPRKNEIKHELRARIDIDISDLFWGALNVTAETTSRVEGMNYCRMNMALNTPLLSKQQEESLNPLSITVLRADGMPDKPINYSELNKLCSPVFTRFNFFSDPHTHQSLSSQRHEPRVAFNTRHLVLAGLIDEDVLKEDLMRRKLVIEIHDRELKKSPDMLKLEQELGVEESDETAHTGPFGIATFALNDLATGSMLVEMVSPVLPGRGGHPGKGGLQGRPLPPAHWLEAGTTIAIRVESKYPVLAASSLLAGGVFRRVVITTSAQDEATPLLVQLAVENCNARALGIRPSTVGNTSDESNETALVARRLALQNHVLTEDEAGNAELDIITGHHIFDGEVRIILLEGIVDSAGLGALLASLPSTPSVQVHDETSRTYNQRLWTSFSTLMHTFLARPIKELLGRTEMYLRMRTSEACLTGLQSLQKMLDMHGGSIDVFPTMDMIRTLTNSYGENMDADYVLAGFAPIIPSHQNEAATAAETLTRAEGADVGDTSAKSSTLTLDEDGTPSGMRHSRSRRLRREKRVDDTNDLFEQLIAHRVFRQPNFVAINIKLGPSSSLAVPYERSYDHGIYNYSIQRCSTTAEQMEELRFKMSQDQNHVYSYGGTYLSQLIPRVDYEAELRKREWQERRKWQTESGFTVAS